MTEFLRAASDAAARISGRLGEGWLEEYSNRYEIGAGGDVSAGIDKMAEEFYLEAFDGLGQIDSEESGIIGDGEARIVLDPIDGSDNALSGLPYFGSSIALERDGRVEEAVVVNLANGDLFYKSDGPLMRGRIGGAHLSQVYRRESASIGVFERAYAYPELAKRVFEEGIKFRSPGAVALSLAYAHYVDFVIFAGPRRRYDFAAALWMCEGLEIVERENLLIVAKDPETAEILRRAALHDEG